MPAFSRRASNLMLLHHAGRGSLMVVLCGLILLGRLLVWLVKTIGWLVTKCRAPVDG